VLHDRGGAHQRAVIELGLAQAALGHEIRILSPEASASTWEHRGLNIDGVRVRARRPLRDYEFLVGCRRALRVHPPEVLHVHSLQEGARFSFSLGIPTVLSVDYFRYRAATNRFVHRYYFESLSKFDRILPVSRACEDGFRKFWEEPAPIAVVPNGVDIERFKPDAEAARRGRDFLEIDGPIVLYVGRICEQKGTQVLLDAWDRCRPDATLVLAGPFGQFGNSQPSGLSDRIQSLGIQCLGAVEDDTLPGLYNACDVFVMPTVRDEMFGMAALEAQSCGKPVVASELGGLLESVGAESGFFVPPGNSHELGRALNEMISDPGRLIRMGSEGRAHAVLFSWREVALQAQSVYDSVVR